MKNEAVPKYERITAKTALFISGYLLVFYLKNLLFDNLPKPQVNQKVRVNFYSILSFLPCYAVCRCVWKRLALAGKGWVRLKDAVA